MAESIIFLLIIGFALIWLIYIFNVTWIDPRILISVLFLLILPGFYAAVTSGPFVPSSRKRHMDMLMLADLSPSDVVYDLGFGDGRLIFSAAPHVKKAIGYELSIPLVVFAKIKAFIQRSKVSIRFGNIWKQDYSDADVIFCYLLPGAMDKFFKEVWPKLKPGTRVVSNAFKIHHLEPAKQEDKVYLYIVS